MFLNAKIGGCMIFWRFQAARHISRANCAEINEDIHGQAAYGICSIERRLRRSKSQFWKKTLRTWASKSGTPVKVIIMRESSYCLSAF